MKAISNNGVVAVEPIVATKIETDATGGFAKIKQKYNLVASVLVMDCLIGDECYRANRHRALLKGEVAFSPWAKEIYEYNGEKFILVPLSSIIGFEVIP